MHMSVIKTKFKVGDELRSGKSTILNVLDITKNGFYIFKMSQTSAKLYCRCDVFDANHGMKYGSISKGIFINFETI